MMTSEVFPPALSQTLQTMQDKDQPYAVATIVRTVGATAAKPGAKAILASDGTILEGWLGGGCTRAAVKRAAYEALKAGTPRLVSIMPEALLEDQGVTAGQDHQGVTYARNGCPSEGTVDIFIEPWLPVPELTIIGQSPVARALSELAPQFRWNATSFAAASGLPETSRKRFIVVATQGQGDFEALCHALATDTAYCSFVGSKRKFAALSERLIASGISKLRVSAIKAPAGLHIHAVTPEEIALSILAELVLVRRQDVHEIPPVM